MGYLFIDSVIEFLFSWSYIGQNTLSLDIANTPKVLMWDFIFSGEKFTVLTYLKTTLQL